MVERAVLSSVSLSPSAVHLAGARSWPIGSALLHQPILAYSHTLPTRFPLTTCPTHFNMTPVLGSVFTEVGHQMRTLDTATERAAYWIFVVVTEF